MVPKQKSYFCIANATDLANSITPNWPNWIFFCEDNQSESGKSFLHNDHRKIVGVHFEILKRNLTAKEVEGEICITFG